MLIQTAYQSETDQPLHPQAIFQIQKAATTYNLQHDITSCVCIEGTKIFQVLEGDIRVLAPLMRAIQNDPMHKNIEILKAKDISRRQFENWAFASFTPKDSFLNRVLESLELETLVDLPTASRINILKLACAQKFWSFNTKGFRRQLKTVPTRLPNVSHSAAA